MEASRQTGGPDGRGHSESGGWTDGRRGRLPGKQTAALRICSRHSQCETGRLPPPLLRLQPHPASQSHVNVEHQHALLVPFHSHHTPPVLTLTLFSLQYIKKP